MIASKYLEPLHSAQNGLRVKHRSGATPHAHRHAYNMIISTEMKVLSAFWDFLADFTQLGQEPHAAVDEAGNLARMQWAMERLHTNNTRPVISKVLRMVCRIYAAPVLNVRAGHLKADAAFDATGDGSYLYEAGCDASISGSGTEPLHRMFSKKFRFHCAEPWWVKNCSLPLRCEK